MSIDKYGMVAFISNFAFKYEMIFIVIADGAGGMAVLYVQNNGTFGHNFLCVAQKR